MQDGQTGEREELETGEGRERADGAEVKGWRNGLVLILPSGGAWDDVIEQVHARLDEARARSFWRGAQTTIDCGKRSLSVAELETLQHRIRGGFGLIPVAVITTSPETRASAEKLVLTVYEELPVVRKPGVSGSEREPSEAGDAGHSQPAPAAMAVAAPGSVPPVMPNNALYLAHTVRSGQRVVHDGNIVICGDVNPGSEVMAGGDILIFGVLRGLAHAGCYGDDTATIVAISLRPPQLRIATKIARAPEEPTRGAGGSKAPSVPEIARIVNGEIQVFPL